MNKKLAATLSGSAVLAVVLSGCGGDDKVNAWADSVCHSVRPQAKKIAAANSELQKETSGTSKPEDVQKADINAFGDMSDAYKAIAAGLDKAGAPPVDNGDKKRSDVVKELNGVSSSYSELKQKAEKLNTKDQSDFASGLDDVSEQLGSLSKTGNDALKDFESGDVGKAMQKQKSCQSLSGSASPSS